MRLIWGASGRGALCYFMVWCHVVWVGVGIARQHHAVATVAGVCMKIVAPRLSWLGYPRLSWFGYQHLCSTPELITVVVIDLHHTVVQ